MPGQSDQPRHARTDTARLVGAAIALVALVAIPRPGNAVTYLPADPTHAWKADPLFDPDQVCDGPVTTPICATKTWISCYAVRAADCELVGVRRDAPARLEREFNTPGKYQGLRPIVLWRDTWRQIGRTIHEYDIVVHYGRRVEPDRFKTVFGLPPSRIGEVEIVLLHIDLLNHHVAESVFLKKVDNRWTVTSFQERMVRGFSNLTVCKPFQDPPYYSVAKFSPANRPKCDLLAVWIEPFPLMRIEPGWSEPIDVDKDNGGVR